MAAPKQQFILPRALSRIGIIGRIALVLGALSMEQAWRIEIHEQIGRRTTQQNRYLWGVVYPTLCQRLPGWDAEDVHEYMLGECFGWETLQGLGRKRIKPIKRSSRLTKQEFSDYVDFVQRRAAEHGVFIPDANPDYWMAA